MVLQRQAKRGQQELDLGDDAEQAQADDEFETVDYVYRAITTSHDDWSDSEIVHWYNRRGEASENRIKELKSDFGGDTLPCGDFNANDLYFNLAALAYNLYALLRDALPGALSRRRATTMRPLLYFLPAKVVKTGRRVVIKLQAAYRKLLERVVGLMRDVAPPATAPPA